MLMRKLLLLVIILSLMSGAVYPAVVDRPTASKFDEFADICCEDEMARLDNFAIELQNNPEARGVIIFYGGRLYPSCYNRNQPRRPRRGEALMRTERMMEYLVRTRGINQTRLVWMNGGYRESWTAELWLLPKGADLPTATPTLQLKDIEFRKGKVRSSDFACME
ncbi:MAG: hypothetical protein H7Y30_04450 [Pyrinomonadaceae bacterium]|nr:hypothetical protein [Pyrinomonadaceae bacterium]